MEEQKAVGGGRVVFANPTFGYEHHQKIAGEYLVVGGEYTIERVSIGDWHTDVYLKEVPNISFNSVIFEDAT